MKLDRRNLMKGGALLGVAKVAGVDTAKAEDADAAHYETIGRYVTLNYDQRAAARCRMREAGWNDLANALERFKR